MLNSKDFLLANTLVAQGMWDARTSWFPEVMDYIQKNPDSLHADALAKVIENFSRAMIRPNSYKKVQAFLRENPRMLEWLALIKKDKQSLIKSLSNSIYIGNFLSKINSWKLDIESFQLFMENLLSAQDLPKMIILMNDYNMSFCRILSECFNSKIKPEDKIGLFNFPWIGDEDNFIEAEWIIDLIIKSLTENMHQYMKTI